MKLGRRTFKDLPRKSITLMGMSGVGKTYLSGMMEQWGWERYSCDYNIANNFLADRLGKKMQSAEDIDELSTFIGRPGNPDLCGLPYDEFKKRQEYYYAAECAALKEVSEKKPQANFVNDSTGSLCEILNEDLLAQLGEKTLFIYLKADKKDEEIVLDRALNNPKPLFFPPFQLDLWVDEFLLEKGLQHADEMVPDEFSRWVFPKLFGLRIPKYQRLADLYGVTIPSRTLQNLKDENDFINRVAEVLA